MVLYQYWYSTARLQPLKNPPALRATPFCKGGGYFFSRSSAARAWACRPSPWASVEAMRPSLSAPSADTSMIEVRFWKS